MNILLWIVQALLAVLYVVAGGTKLFMFEKFAQQVASTRALPHGVWVAIGVFELLCGVGLVVPGAARAQPSLTAIAAIGLAVEGVLFAGLHIGYGEYGPTAFSIVLAALAAFVAYGRLVLRPF